MKQSNKEVKEIKKEFEEKFVSFNGLDNEFIKKEIWSTMEPIISKTISQTRQEVIEEIIIKIDLIIGRHKKEHQCRFNDGKQKCECYLEGLNRVKRQLHSQTK